MSRIQDLLAGGNGKREKVKVSFSLPAFTYKQFQANCDAVDVDYSHAVTALMDDFNEVRAAADQAKADAQAPDVYIAPNPPLKERLPLSTTRGDAGVKRRWTKKKQD